MFGNPEETGSMSVMAAHMRVGCLRAVGKVVFLFHEQGVHVAS